MLRFTRLALVAVSLLVGASTWAATFSELSPAQRDTLKTAIYADPAIAPAASAADDQAVSDYMNQNATPAFWVWRTAVPVEDIRGAVVLTELDNLSNAKWRSFEWTVRFTVDASKAGDRKLFTDALSAGAPQSLTALLGDANNAGAFARRATRAEKVLAVGTGSTASPARMVAEGLLTPAIVSNIIR